MIALRYMKAFEGGKMAITNHFPPPPPPPPPVEMSASLLLTFRQINKAADVAFRIVRGSDFEEIDVPFKDGWADFDFIEDFSQGGQVRLVGNTGQGIARDFTQDTYVHCAVILDGNGDWYYDQWGNRAFRFGVSPLSGTRTGQWYRVEDTTFFNINLKDRITFSFVAEWNRVTSRFSQPIVSKYHLGSSTYSWSVSRSMDYGEWDHYLKFSSNASFRNISSHDPVVARVDNISRELQINEVTQPTPEPFKNAGDALNRSFLIGQYDSGQNNNHFNGLMTEVIGWETIDLKDKMDAIKNKIKEIYNVV